MEESKEYYLQRYADNGQWKEVVKSYESESLIYAGKLRGEKGDICRVLDNDENVLWQMESALENEDAQ